MDNAALIVAIAALIVAMIAIGIAFRLAYWWEPDDGDHRADDETG